MTELGQIIKSIRKQKGLTQKQMAELTGFKQNTISNHENGRRGLKESDLAIYAKALEMLPKDFFETDKDQKSNSISLHPQVLALDKALNAENHEDWISYGTELLEEQNQQNRPLIEYRVYERLSAGQGSNYYEDYHYDSVYYDEDISHDLASWIYGDSMEPAYLNGEVALIKEASFDLDGAVYAVAWAGQTYIKRVYLEEDGFRLVSLNPKYAPLFAHKDEEPRIVGKVVGHFMPLEV
ncbi:transcriptional regulator with XRE-family HTH domain [Streptococcus rupicaprae]|uniref:Transcriptional regulator with XRE-family HTH domain n=1 Tax=Streptococcus rupicaprae TaxID=759619 RepID=A0ABV2FFF5_9STRE